jgi:hypothetical protein
MGFFETWLGDEVWPLIGLIAIIALGLAIAMVATGRGRFIAGIVALGCIALLLLAIEYLWVTDRERVDGIIRDMASSAVREDAAAMVRHLSPRCHYGKLDRAAIERLAASTFDQFAIDRVNISSRKTELFPMRNEARADFLAVVRGRQDNVEFRPYPTRWILTFVKSPQGVWQVEEIEQIPALGSGNREVGIGNRE